MLTHTESSNYLFCHNSLLSNTIIDVTLELEKEYSGRIVDYELNLGSIRIVNESLEDTIIKNFKSYRMARFTGKDYYHDGLLIISNRETAKRITTINNGAFSNMTLALQEKNEWYTLSGRNKLEYLLQKMALKPPEKAKITTFIRQEGSQYKALIGLAHIVPWFISRMNNNASLTETLDKLPRWY